MTLIRPHADPDLLLLRYADGHEGTLDRREAAQLAAELLTLLSPAEAAHVARATLARPEVRQAEEQATARQLLEDLERDGGAGEVDAAGEAWEAAYQSATPEQRAQGEEIAARQAGERAAVRGIFGEE